MLWDTSVDAERLELDEIVELWDTAVVGDKLELDDIVTLWDTSVVGDRLELKDVVADRLVVCDALVDTLADGELVIAWPAPTATKAMFVVWYQNVTSGGFVSPTE